jgi:hypothetical protein
MKPLSTLSVAELRSLRGSNPCRASEINAELQSRCEGIIAMNYRNGQDSHGGMMLRAMRRDFAT